jgi:endogenous inhibitor of DNA gyrase (YacG/DUF329 family)
VCGKPAQPEHRPFCSRRCADIDLNRWLSGRYVIPASEETPESNGREDGDEIEKRH